MGEFPPSPGTSSVDGSDDEPLESQPGGRITSRHAHDDHSGAGIDAEPTQPDSPKAPTTVQKRRRVTRACDESPQYVEALENRLEKAEALLKTVLPDVNLDDPKYDAMMPQRMHVPIKQETDSPSNGIEHRSGIHSANGSTATEADKDSLLESMVLEAGSLHLDDQGHWDFFGQSSGMIFLRRMREQFGDLLAKFDDTGLPFTKSSSVSGRLMSPKPTSVSMRDSTKSNIEDLPAKPCALKLCQSAINDAAALFPFVHKPTFYRMFDRIYDIPRALYEPADEKFLPLFYSVIALGCLFETGEESMLQSYGYESAIDSGYLLFRCRRSPDPLTPL
ncbi:MAG: hypothetical protein Q9176_001691 [Flavoplaca citrina]